MKNSKTFVQSLVVGLCYVCTVNVLRKLDKRIYVAIDTFNEIWFFWFLKSKEYRKTYFPYTLTSTAHQCITYGGIVCNLKCFLSNVSPYIFKKLLMYDRYVVLEKLFGLCFYGFSPLIYVFHCFPSCASALLASFQENAVS